MSLLITLYSIFLLILIFSAFGFVMFYIFSIYTHKNDRPYPGKKAVQGLIVFSMTWILFLLFIPFCDIVMKFNLQSAFFGFDLDVENIYYVSIFITIVICFLNIACKNYYQHQGSTMSRRLAYSIKKSWIYVAGYLAASAFVYYVCRYLHYNRRIDIVSPKIFIMSYQTQSFVPRSSVQVLEMLIDIDIINSLMAPFIFLCVIYFSVYGACSLSLFPLEALKQFIYSPQKPEPDFQVYSKQNLIDNGQKLINEGKRIYQIQRELDLGIVKNPREKKKRQKALKRDVILYKKRLFQYEELCEYFRSQENLAKINPLKRIFKFVLILLAFLISYCIYVQYFLLISSQDFLIRNISVYLEQKQKLFPHIIFMMCAVYLAVAIFDSLRTITIYLPLHEDFFPLIKNKTYDDAFLESLPIVIMTVFGFQLFLPLASNNYYAQVQLGYLTRQIFYRVHYFKKLNESGLYWYAFILIFTVSMFISLFIMPARKRFREMNLLIAKKEKQKKTKIENLTGQLNQLLSK